MNLELLKVGRSGDKSILYNLLPPEDASSKDPMGEIPEDAEIQENTSCLLKVTLEENTDLRIVASRRYLESAENIHPRVISLLTATNKRFDTPLHCAARVGNDKMVSYIIDLATRRDIKDEVLRAVNQDKANALHEAAKYDHVQVAEILMDKDAELASMSNCFGMSPLYLAIVSRSLKVAKFLLQFSFDNKTSSISLAGPDNKTALHVAVLMNREITQDLLNWKPMLIKHADSLGRTPLHYAASNGDHYMVKLLLEKDSSTAYLEDAKGLFPIHFAASMKNVLVAEQILEHCPDADELLDKGGKNFLHVAFEQKRLDLVRKIISKRPDLRKLLNDQDYCGNTPLHTAVKNNDQASVHFLLRDKTVLVNIVNRKGFTPLDLAYAKLNEDLPFRTNSAEVCIASCLASIKAQFGPQELPDLESGELSSDEAKERSDSSDDEAKVKPASSSKVKVKPASSSKAKVKSASRSKASSKAKVKPASCSKAKVKPASSSTKAKGNPFGSKKSQQKEEGFEIGRQVNLAKNLGIAAVLIATVTFAAGFTLPGGYIADDHPGRGTAVLAKEYTFKVFLISDASALVCSIIATCWLMYAGTAILDKHNRRRALSWAMLYLWEAFAGMCAAFAMGIYAALGPSCKRMSILVCIVSLGAPIFAHMVANYNVYRMLETVRIRQGYKECIWPTIHLPDKKCLFHNLRPNRLVINFLLLTLGTYAVFFLLAML